MAKITSLPDDVEFDAHPGETLLEAALRAELPLTHACGGRAKCSTCRVWVLSGLDECPSRTEAERMLAERLGLDDAFEEILGVKVPMTRYVSPASCSPRAIFESGAWSLTRPIS